MRKQFPIDLEKYSDEEWIDLPQGTHIHPKEIEKMFDDKEMGEEGREFGAEILPSGEVIWEDYGTSEHLTLSGQPYEVVKDSTITHSHPLGGLPVLSPGDLGAVRREMRAFSQKKEDPESGQIHAFYRTDAGTKQDIIDRHEIGDRSLYASKRVVSNVTEHPIRKYKNSMYTSAEFDLARKGLGKTSVIHVKKSDNPDKIYITGIRSTKKDEPQYDLLQTLPRKKKKTQPVLNRINLSTSINFGKINLNGLNQFLIKPKPNKLKPTKKCKCK